MPLAPRTARALHLAIGEGVSGPVLVGPNGRRLDRHGAGRIVRRVARRPGIDKRIGPHTLSGTRSSPPPWTQACLSAMCKKRRATPTRARRCAMTLPGFRWTATPHT